MSGFPLGRFCWYELLTTDPEGAAAFYGRITGWATEAWEGGDAPYEVWMKGEQGIGGLMALPGEVAGAGVPPHWLPYLATPDAAATIAQAEELGASVLWGPQALPEVGTVAALRDPQGAVFCIHQPAGEIPGTDGPPGVGDISWHELPTTDGEAALAFYRTLFGWQEAEEMDMGEAGMYRMFHNGAHPLGGIYDKPPEIPMPAWILYIRVPDVDAAASTVEELGGRVLHGPMEVPGGDRIVQCSDPQGGVFALHSTAGS